MAGGGKGAAVLIQRGIMQYRQSKENAKNFQNWFPLCMSLIEMANILPYEAKYKGKPFRDFLDEEVVPAMPKDILEKDSLDIAAKKEIRLWYFTYSPIIERVVADYVYQFYKRNPSGSL